MRLKLREWQKKFEEWFYFSGLSWKKRLIWVPLLFMAIILMMPLAWFDRLKDQIRKRLTH